MGGAGLHCVGNPVTLRDKGCSWPRHATSSDKASLLTLLQGANSKLPGQQGWGGENTWLGKGNTTRIPFTPRKENTTRIPLTPRVRAAAARLSHRDDALRAAFFWDVRINFQGIPLIRYDSRPSCELITSFCFGNCPTGCELSPPVSLCGLSSPSPAVPFKAPCVFER